MVQAAERAGQLDCQLCCSAGILAYRAGIIQAKATQRAAAEQVEAAERTKRLEARGIAVAVDLGFLTLESDIQRARDGLSHLKSVNRFNIGQIMMAQVQVVSRIESPPILERNIDRLFMLGDHAGPLCLQLVHMLYEHDVLTSASVSRMGPMGPEEWHAEVDKVNLNLVELNEKVAACKRAVQPLSRLR